MAFLEDLMGGTEITPELAGVHKQIKALGPSDDLATLQKKHALHKAASQLAKRGSALHKHHVSQAKA
jgi:hypothetical protein